nr:acylphosphatase-2 isoform X3 [Caretta caretta]
MPQRWGGARSPSSPHRAWAGSFGPGTDSAWHAAAFPRSLSRARCRPGPASRAQEVRAARPGSVGPGHSRSGSEQAGFLACTLPCPPSPRPPAPSSVCFRMYTEDEARKMGVVGWVKNTRQGTVTGQVQGPEDKVNAISCIFHCVSECLPAG